MSYSQNIGCHQLVLPVEDLGQQLLVVGNLTHVTKVPAPRVARKKPAPCGAGSFVTHLSLL